MVKNIVVGGAIVFVMVMSSCSPFGGQSIVDVISDKVTEILDGKTNVGVVSGATEELETNPSVPSLNYKASVAVGGQFGQQVTQTSSGYQVYTSVQGNQSE